MKLNKYHIGELIEPYKGECGIPDLSSNDVSGINIDKEFFEPAKQVGKDTSKYKVVPPDYFACNLMHVGRDAVLPVALNQSDHNKIVSPAYSVFGIKNEVAVLKEYFFILLKSSEKDRYFWFHTDSSVRQGLPWKDFCDIEIFLPSIEQQRKYVDVYLALQSNLAAYQSKVDELKLICDGYIEELRRKMECEKIGDYIERYSEKNLDKAIDDVVGLSTEKRFRVAQSRVNRNELGGYKIVHPLDIAYVPTTDTWKVLAFAVNHFEKDVVVSPIYEVFKTKGKLESDYLAIWLKREEFDRYARYNSWGSARENFTFEEMQNVEIPIPDISVQREIVNIHKCYIERQRIAEALKEQLKNICPVLIRGSLME
ncbi:MAG: restriction endonuclease subunit S [Paludibacteraceae bacterium]|nr:restriction endonuclease subunit S [Paludibacteraceae bacterium]